MAILISTLLFTIILFTFVGIRHKNAPPASNCEQAADDNQSCDAASAASASTAQPDSGNTQGQHVMFGPTAVLFVNAQNSPQVMFPVAYKGQQPIILTQHPTTGAFQPIIVQTTAAAATMATESDQKTDPDDDKTDTFFVADGKLSTGDVLVQSGTLMPVDQLGIQLPTSAMPTPHQAMPDLSSTGVPDNTESDVVCAPPVGYGDTPQQQSVPSSAYVPPHSAYVPPHSVENTPDDDNDYNDEMVFDQTLQISDITPTGFEQTQQLPDDCLQTEEEVPNVKIPPPTNMQICFDTLSPDESNDEVQLIDPTSFESLS